MNVILILCDTLRRDHCGPYHQGRPLNACWSKEQPGWVVPTPNMDRLGARGTVFTNAWCGSSPCMPARRDIYTGRLEFLERGWGPLEDDDLDLHRQVSGEPNLSLHAMRRDGHPVSYLVSDHFHLWEQGAGNYHMGYTGFKFIRGIEADGLYTDPVDFFCPPDERMAPTERHWRNVHFIRHQEQDYFPARVFTEAADWLGRNHTHEDFYLHIDCFAPHEPWDPPEALLKPFWPSGYNVDFTWTCSGPYAKWKGRLSETQMNFVRARYAANVVLTDRWLGKLLDQLDALNLWRNTLVIFTSDHGTYNGDHGRIGKRQTHQHDAVGHVPLIICHPVHGHGASRAQLVQLVDLYPTVLAAVGKPAPRPERGLHGINLLPVLEEAHARTRDYALAGEYGRSVTLTDGRWILHQSPPDVSAGGNQPLRWYGHRLSRYLPYELGPYEQGRRAVTNWPAWPTPTWLSDKERDPNELVNLAAQEPEKLKQMQAELVRTLEDLGAPPEQKIRLGL